ncbi:Sialin [Dirofilaria immitis]|nr:Sialin [Dirofilaria immitis]
MAKLNEQNTVMLETADNNMDEVTTENNGNNEGYTKEDRTMILSSVAIGALVTILFITHALQYFGLRVIFFASGMLTAISTMLVPLAISQNSIVYFIILRILQGVSFTVCMPTTGAITSSWASLKQNGFSFQHWYHLANYHLFLQWLLLACVGWPAVYYLHGGVSFIVFGIWVLLYRNQPGISKKHQKIPYLAILSTPAIWGVWAAAIADLMTLQLIQMFGPQYINEILGYSVEATGFSAALSIFAGYTSDRLRILSETAKLRLYNSIALGISAVFLIILAFLPRGYPLTGVVLLTLATSMYGFNGGGFNKCATLVSRQYSAFVLGHIQIIWCISMLLSPILVNGLLGEGTIYDWRIIFIIHAILSLATNVYFCIVAVSDAAWWTDDERVKIRMRSDNDNDDGNNDNDDDNDDGDDDNDDDDDICNNNKSKVMHISFIMMINDDSDNNNGGHDD